MISLASASQNVVLQPEPSLGLLRCKFPGTTSDLLGNCGRIMGDGAQQFFYRVIQMMTGHAEV